MKFSYIIAAIISWNLVFINMTHADLIDTGYLDVSYQDFNFYKPKTVTGTFIKTVYTESAQLRESQTSFHSLPNSFDPIIAMIKTYIDSNSVQEICSYSKSGRKSCRADRNKFYSGTNGIKNGREFDFSKEHLPTKIARLSFCFGIDPLIYTSLLSQESKFSKSAISATKATGFSQLTGDAIAEVSEQLGILGSGYQSNDASKILNKYITCYYGPNKKWVNIWEDPKNKYIAPYGKSSYRFSKKGGRFWKNVSLSKKWLDEDPDRNLVYGAIYFKTLLNRKTVRGAYDRALMMYNVGQKHTYLRRIKNFYSNIVPEFRDRISDLESNKSNIQQIGAEYFEFTVYDYDCRVEVDDSSWILPMYTKGLIDDSEVFMSLLQQWVDARKCVKRTTSM